MRHAEGTTFAIRPHTQPASSVTDPLSAQEFAFARAHALDVLSKLAVWWLRLGIALERIKPGKPQQNGRHERMHLTLKIGATKPAANVLQQQARF